MNSYWPTGFDLEDTSSPREILEAARRQWNDNSDGLLTLVVQEAESSNKNHLLIVHAKHVPSNRTATLFSIVHRPGSPYPARIQPKGDELPDLFKKSYHRPGIGDMASSFRGVTGGEVTNEWVCDTPSEFRSKLEKVFNLGSLKSDVLSLVSGAPPREEFEGGEAPEQPSKDEPDDSST